MGLNLIATIRNWLGICPDAGLSEDVMHLPTEDAECMIDGKAVSINYYPLANPVEARADDKMRCSVNRSNGETEMIEADINMAMRVDTIGVFRVQDALGFRSAIGGVFGERNG